MFKCEFQIVLKRSPAFNINKLQLFNELNTITSPDQLKMSQKWEEQNGKYNNEVTNKVNEFQWKCLHI